jgi:nucleoid DNA-binding protein
MCIMAKEAAKEKSTKSITKGQFLADLAEHSGLSKADVTKVVDALSDVIVKELGPKGPGVLALPGLFKLKAKHVPKQKGGKEVPNRFKPGETTITKDKPASTKVSARPLKALKEALTPKK